MFLKFRYLILSAIVFALMCLSVSKQYWVGDFWMHSAVIHELAFNPLHPKHPQLSLEAPHPFYSPYALAWSLVSRVTHWNPLKTLSLAAVCNIALLLIGLYLFSSAIYPKDGSGVAYYSLLFILLLWGATVWNWSGFTHLRGLGYVLPYPSTFCLAITFIALALNKRRIDKNQDFWLVPILLLSVTTLLSHPFTFIFLASGLLAMMFVTKRPLIPELLRVGGVFLGTLLLAVLWPYYPFLKFILGESGAYNISNSGMYRDVVMNVWPALIGLPLLAMDLRANWRQPLPLMFGFLLFVYIAGGIVKSYSYGRALSFMVILLDITIALHLVKLENKLKSRGAGVLNRPWILCTGVTLILIAFSYNNFIAPALERSIFSARKSYEYYYFLSEYTDHYDPIMAKPSIGAMLPTFGGKVVGFGEDAPFVPDAKIRLEDVKRFFDVNTTQEDRVQVLQKYGVKYILLEKTKAANWTVFREKMRELGDIVYQNRRFILYSVSIQ